MVSDRRTSITVRAERENVRFIDLQFTDVLGLVKSVTVTANRFRHVQRNREWFDGSAIEGTARVLESDMFLKPDPDSFAVLPWSRDGERIARVICDIVTPHGEPYAGDPRYALRRVLDSAAEAGLSFQVSPELEFFLFEPSSGGQADLRPHDHAGYFDLSTDRGHLVRRAIVNDLEAMGIEVEASHHEVAAGQHEVDLCLRPALATADALVTARWVVREVAQRHGLQASFMPKPIFGLSGSGLHIHQCLTSAEDGANLFDDPDAPYGLSRIARHFIAGQLAHARGMCVVLAPLVNSYKRLAAGFEAPAHLSWARRNRSALIRVPEGGYSDAPSTLVELRLPDPSCNPYLALAVMLQAGLDGLDRELPLPEPVEENPFAYGLAADSEFSVHTVPQDLAAALDELERDDIVGEALGSVLRERFIEAKRMEWEEYRLQVTPWEIEKYLSLY